MKFEMIGRVGRFGILVFSSLALFACSSNGPDPTGVEKSTADSRVIPVRVVDAESREVLVEHYAVGRLVSRNAPSLAAEIDARIIDVLVEEGEAVIQGQDLVLLDTNAIELARREALADIERLKVTIDNEQRRVARYRDLKKQDMMPQERLDDAEAQLAVNEAALSAAEARLAITQDRLIRARLKAPFDGVVEERHVSIGDFATIGKPLITITDTQSLWARLPFPETVGYQLKVGQELYIESAVAPGQIVQARIDQIRPEVGSVNKSLIVIADVKNPGFWRPEATIEATVIIERRTDAVVVPALSVVSRPAGDVVYLLDSSHVKQQVVVTGEFLDGWVEIRSGLNAGQMIVTEGAHYLSDGAAVSVRESGS